MRDLGVDGLHGVLQQRAMCVDEQVTLAALGRFPAIVARVSAIAVVLTGWSSMNSAVGCELRPIVRESLSRKASVTCSRVPSSRHWA